MQIHDVQQGSTEWLELRATHCCASEAAAMLGLCNKTSRNELLRMKATGDGKEFSDYVQKNILDRGHEVEALARPHAEAFLGEELYPVVGTEVIEGVPVLASYDGLTMMEAASFEHKQPNKELIAYINDYNDLPDTHWPQAEQQLLVMGNKPDDFVLFVVSDGSEAPAARIKYKSRPDRQERLIPGWKQFLADLANYTHVEVIPAAVAAAQPTLPAVSVQVTGQIAVRDNLTNFGDALKAYIERINKKPETDQDFADLDATVKKLKESEDALSAAEASAIAQTGDVDLLCRTINDLRELARQNRLAVEKIVKAEKENRKNVIIYAGKLALQAHVASLNDSLKRVRMPDVAADFNGCAKNLRTFSSLQNAVDTCLANAKIEANQIADGIRFNLTTYDEIGPEYPALFPDLAVIVRKAKDDFTTTLKLRISEHREAERLRADRDAEAKRQQEAAAAHAAQIEADRKATETKAPAEAMLPSASIDTPVVAEAKNQTARAGLDAVANVTQLRPASSGVMSDDDLRTEITERLKDMDRQQLNLVLMFCKDKLAA